MPNQREPIELLKAKNRKHLTKSEIAEREATEIKAPSDGISPPEYLSGAQKAEFNRLVGELMRIQIVANVDAGEVARYVVAHTMYARYTKLLRTMPKKKAARIRELRERLAREEGRCPDEGARLDDEELALDLERALTVLQEKFFNQCEQTARALGLNITSRCRIMIPEAPPAPRVNKFDRFTKGAGAG